MSLNVIRIFFLNITDRDFPTIHLILVSTNGTVWDISLNENISPSKKKLLKLPNSCLYHGYSDDKGIVYFINGNLQKKMIKYHESFKRNGGTGFREGKKVYSVKHETCYAQSLWFGNYFWLLGYWHPHISCKLSRLIFVTPVLTRSSI